MRTVFVWRSALCGRAHGMVVIALLGFTSALIPLCSAADVSLVRQPDANTFWIETFSPIALDPDSTDGWFPFEPEEIGVEQAGDRVRFREVSEYAGGSIQRHLPLGGTEYGYLQIRVTAVEKPEHYGKAWLRLPGSGHPQLGRTPLGVTTIDLSGMEFFATETALPLDLAVIGPPGNTPSGYVELDWVRLVKRPLGGLTMALVEDGPADGVAGIGDRIQLRFFAEGLVRGPLSVAFTRAKDGSPIRLNSAGNVVLADSGDNGDAAAGDGVFTALVLIDSDATELAAGAAEAKAGAVMVTMSGAGEPRNVTNLFGFDILPSLWRAQRAAASVVMGAEVLSEEFASDDISQWRPYAGTWAVHVPRNDKETRGLRSNTYDKPAPLGLWIAVPAPAMEDSCVSARVRPDWGGARAPAMLALHFADAGNHYRLSVTNADQVTIERVRAGRRDVLASTKLPTSIVTGYGEPASKVEFAAAGPLLVGFIDGNPVIHAYDSAFETGQAALGLNRLNGQFEEVVLREARLRDQLTGAPSPLPRVQILLDERQRCMTREAGQRMIRTRVTCPEALPAATLNSTLISRTIYRHPLGSQPVPAAAAGEPATIALPMDPNWFRAGRYQLVCELLREGKVIASDNVEIVVAKPVPVERMDVFCWGGANIAGQIRELADAGFTVMHEFSQRNPELFELGCELGLTYYSYPPNITRAPAALKAGYANPKASSSSARVSELDPRFRKWALDNAVTHAKKWRRYPRQRYILLNSEFENHQLPDLSPEAEKRYEEKLGFPRPGDADALLMSPAVSMKHFPDRIIPDDSPLYRWYQFFYRDGGGGLSEITSVQGAAIAEVAPGLVTFHDPVLRGPQFHGRWEGLTLLNHWTYVEQNPIDVLAFADEMVCLGRRTGWRQKVSQMIQVIMYAESAMPNPPPNTPAYLRDAPFAALPPDIISEAMWLVLSRPVDMIAFHGLGTALETDETVGYRYTNPHTLVGVGRVTRELVRPYGPVLTRVKEQVGPRVALLLSGANTIFGRIGEGGGGKGLHNVLTAARFPVDVVYDEDIQDGALKRYRVLAIAQASFMLRSVRTAVDAFQKSGGIVLLDRKAKLKLPGALVLPDEGHVDAGSRELEIVPGEVLPLPDAPRARLDAGLRRNAEALRALLLPRLGEALAFDSSHPHVVINARRSGDVTYIFAVNDRRTIGPYLGRFGAVLEAGVPIAPRLLLRDRPGALYDALARRPMSLTDEGGGRVGTTVELGPGRGKLLVACRVPLGGVRLTVPDTHTRGTAVSVRARVVDSAGEPMSGILPLRFEATTPNGYLSDHSRYVATDENGAWETKLPIARNEASGTWTMCVTELVSGASTQAFMQLTD